MNYYKLAILGLDLKDLTYESEFFFDDFSLVKVNVKSKTLNAVILEKVNKPDFNTSKILEKLDKYFTPFQIELAKFISYYYTCPLGMAFDLFEPFVKVDFVKDTSDFKISPNLSELQNLALDFCNSHDSALLFGDTGSGKSEVYIEKIRQVLNDFDKNNDKSTNPQILFLMPEISLTPQMQQRLEKYFNTKVGIWHSKITPKKKKEFLENFFNSKIQLIAGARSALFLPFSNLKLIIVDEEHDDSYKNNSWPYYNARDLAIYIGKKMQIPIILGSATPSITSFYKIPHFRMKGSFFKGKKDYIFDEKQTQISELIIQEISQVLDKNKQVIIFLPTRANFKFLICQECYSKIVCPFCSVSMSLHLNKNILKCHYCEFSIAIPRKCPSCQNTMFQAQKIGTSEVKSQLEKIFPNVSIAKFDRDEITTQKKLETLLKDFNDKKIDILVGTQMLSKGHDYHEVELAVIMGLDEHLYYTDFRAREKTIALAMQTAGRAGRAGIGKVIIQTLQKDFFSEYLDNYDLFIENEMIFREPLYPPFARLLRILIIDKNEKKAIEIENKIVYELKNIKNLEIIGHGKANIEYIAGKFRHQIILRSNSHTPLIQASKIAKNFGGMPDIDPINFT